MPGRVNGKGLLEIDSIRRFQIVWKIAINFGKPLLNTHRVKFKLSSV